ncbi:MAG: cytochrome c family protein [Pseudomonadota bacterium]
MVDTMTFTKLTGAFCGSLLVLLLGKFTAELIYHGAGHGHGEDHVQGYVIDTGAEDATAEVEEEGPTFAELFASADAGKGEKVFNKCKACHQLDVGANGTGPYLHGIVDRAVGSADGFGYSGNLVAVADTWTPENLDQFLASPSGFAPGTTMAFAGLKKATDRANLIAFLQSTNQ